MSRWFCLGMLSVLPSLCAADGLHIVTNGKAEAGIVVGREASPQAREAAAELQTYVRRMSGRGAARL